MSFFDADNRLRNWTWRDEPVAPGPCVIFDVDGVLADATHRQHYLDGWSDWDAFFDACGTDPVIADYSAITMAITAWCSVVLLTSRPAYVHRETTLWLARHDDRIRWDLLIMRPPGDYRSAPSFKRDSLDDLRAADFDVRLAFDDDPRNIRMYRQEGVPIIPVDSGYHGW